MAGRCQLYCLKATANSDLVKLQVGSPNSNKMTDFSFTTLFTIPTQKVYFLKVLHFTPMELISLYNVAIFRKLA